MKFATLRRYLLSLEGVSETPHHQLSSFRVAGRILATVPPDEQTLNVFVDETARERALVLHPDFVEKLLWGGKVVGVRVLLASASAAAVKGLLLQALSYQTSKPALRARASRRSFE